MDLVLLLVAMFGHAVFWVGLVNRLHATGLPRRQLHVFHWFCLGAVALVPVGYVFQFVQMGVRWTKPIPWSEIPTMGMAYLTVCWVIAVMASAVWLWNRATHRPIERWRSHRRRSLKLGSSAVSEEHQHHFLAHLPGNQVLQIDFTERGLELPRLDPRLEELSIVHLSDLHFTGRVGKAFFREVVHLANDLDADLIAVTGDLVDTEECIDWIPDVLGPLCAKYGAYFVLGNHDRRVDPVRLRRTLGEAGLVDLGGRWIQCTVRGAPVVLAGNELPWFVPAADLSDAPLRSADGGPLRIVLSHSPDQLDWAVTHDVDLMLAGHLHGGQIRLPLIGPILAPSRRGVQFARSGTFRAGPTILHVSRGLSGEFPIRLNCPPELTRLVLHRADG